MRVRKIVKAEPRAVYRAGTYHPESGPKTTNSAVKNLSRSWRHSSSDAWLKIRNASLPASGRGSQNRHGRGKIVQTWIAELTG
jgi:hypothetical protein